MPKCTPLANVSIIHYIVTIKNYESIIILCLIALNNVVYCRKLPKRKTNHLHVTFVVVKHENSYKYVSI